MGVNLANNENVVLTNVSDKFTSLKLPVNALTDFMQVKVKRQTLGGLVVWGDSTVIRVKIAYILDGVEHHVIGQAHGGIRTHPEKGEIQEYTLGYRPTVQYKDGEVKRIGQSAKTEVAAFIEIELLEGPPISTTVSASTTESAPPEKLVHNSVAYDADTSAQDGGAGDGVITLSHTPIGTSDLAAFLGVTSDQPLTGSATYDGNAMTEIWDDASGSWSNSGYYKVGITNSTVNVVSTLDSPGAFLEHLAGVITMTGVHQTTPVGTHALASGTHADTLTVTVGSIGADDLVVDNVGHVDDASETSLGAAGAGQTAQWTQGTGGANNNTNGGGSTQPGTAGGVMSWAHTNNGNSTWRIGAVAFKPAPVVVLEQEGYRFRNDDGDEASATWLAAQDTDVTQPLDTNTRLRVILNATEDPASIAYQLEVLNPGISSYTAVSAGSGHIRLSTSANIPAGGTTATTAQLTSPDGKTSGADFQAGKISDDTNPLPAIDLAAGNKYTELEWCLTAVSGTANCGTYSFRVTQNGTPITSYTVTPKWTMPMPLAWTKA